MSLQRGNPPSAYSHVLHYRTRARAQDVEHMHEARNELALQELGTQLRSAARASEAQERAYIDELASAQAECEARCDTSSALGGLHTCRQMFDRHC
jgi:hypothetical protein